MRFLTLLLCDCVHGQTEGQTAPPVHAPFFPSQLTESWWVLVTFRGENILAVERVTSQERKAVAELKMQAPPQAGKYNLVVYVLPDCYIGFNEEISIDFTVESSSVLPEYQVHAEDKELDNEPSIFEMALQAQNVDESDSDEEDEQEREGDDVAATGAEEEKADNSPTSNDEDK